jgi:glucose-6-phosphate 1-dehydrogenase
MLPTTFIIFGITGDLAGKKVLPAILNLYVNKQLPSKFAIVGFSRRHFDREEFRELIRDHMEIKMGQYREEDVKHFIDHIYYEQGFFDKPESYKNLALRLKKIDDGFNSCSNKLFHLSIPPTLNEGILENLSVSGLTIPCGGNGGWTRVLIEKPFGYDIETAKKLDKKLGQLFNESQIFRIDHYLAKEALQNILAFRFSNSLFEPLWNRNHIEKVHIKLFEKNGVDNRGSTYDHIGALRDVGQNHLLQMLSLVTMERPKNFNSNSLRKERARVFQVLKLNNKKTVMNNVVRAQYEGYKNEFGVRQHTHTETYFRLQTYIDNLRWKNVPFYLESGKALAESKTEIDIYFKNINKDNEENGQNVLTFRIQPDEGIKIRFLVKSPGFGMNVEPKNLKFKYADSKSFLVIPDAYERVLHDAIIGDQTLFASTDEVIYSWKYITSIISNWSSVPLGIYKRGSVDVI